MMPLCIILFLVIAHYAFALEIPEVTPPENLTPGVPQKTSQISNSKTNSELQPLGSNSQPTKSYLQVSFEILRLRERPTTTSPVIVVLKYGEMLELIKKVSVPKGSPRDWLHVKTRSGLTGFVAGEYTRTIPRTEVPMHIPILFFHHIGIPAHDDPYANLHFPAEKLAELAHFLQENNYRTIRTMDLHTVQNTDRVVILNFDDGYDNTYTAAYPILKKYGLTATVYVISGFIGKPGYLTEMQITELAKAGWEIGSHTVTHPNLRSLTTIETKIELQESRQTLSRLTGQDVTTLCYPSGKYNATTLKIAKEVGYSFARTTEPGIVTNLKKPYELPARRVLPAMDERTWKKWF